ncbi:AI-2E family transporter [Bosea sp. NPDC003192]|uniref:AI-2E family transporter n=1 Tax=Bosea sp. NPDC003192 TaxID=3390551 RepID=UPI003D06CB16
MTTPPVRRTMIQPEAGGLGASDTGASDIVRVAATLVSAAVIIAALYYGQDILIPLAFAFLIGFALNPLVMWLRRRGLPKVIAIATVMTVVLVLLGGLFLVLGTQLRSLGEQLPTYQSTIHGKINDLKAQFRAPGMLDGALNAIASLQKEVEAVQGSEAQRVEVVSAPGTQLQVALIWLGRVLEPLATAGIVLVFVVLALLDRTDLRDRLLRILGGNLHRSTDAIEDAGRRISRYLLMQLVVNTTFAIPLALGLWLIGVPGALLWGVVAAVLRFVPYVGALISAIFPLALAFAVDPGWHMVLWTLALIAGLELISNNFVEPMLYGTSTGLSAISLIAAATFWTALWGPVGLILSTPLTVCLLVLGKTLPQLQFLDTLLGSVPVLSPAERIYQRLLAGDVDEAIEIAEGEIETLAVTPFYDSVGISVLRLAHDDYGRQATAAHRLRVAEGMEALLEELREEHPAADATASSPKVVCIGGKWEIDAIAAEMLAHALGLEDIPAQTRRVAHVTANSVARLDLDRVPVVCINYFSSEPDGAARQFCRRLRQRWPELKIVVVLWTVSPEALASGAPEAIGAEEIATSIQEAIGRVQRLLPEMAGEPVGAEAPANDAERVAALAGTGFLDEALRDDLDAIAKRAADAFDVDVAMISAIDAEREIVIGGSKELSGFGRDEAGRPILPRRAAICDYVVAGGETLVVADTERDARFTDNPVAKTWGLRFYAGAPLRSADGFVLGALCILDAEARTLDQREKQLLEKLAGDVVETISRKEADSSAQQQAEPEAEASATVGQQVPE